MTTTVFIAGSMHIKHLDSKVRERIDNIVAQNFEVVIGDADGVDTTVQRHLSSSGAAKAKVFCSGPKPRNNVGDWPVESVISSHAKGTRAYFTAKDLRMAEVADFGLMIWDSRSTGTLSNVIELLSRKKKSVVFVNKFKEFRNVCTIDQLEDLLNLMSDHAKKKADEKIKFSDRIRALRNEQLQMFG